MQEETHVLQGIGVSQGCGIGYAVRLAPRQQDYSAVVFSDATAEKKRLHKAIERFITETDALAKRIETYASADEAMIIKGHAALLNDSLFLSQIHALIDGGMIAEAAVESVCRKLCEEFNHADNYILRQRAIDMSDMRERLLSLLLGANQTAPPVFAKGSILVADTFTPSEIACLSPEKVVALVAENGTAASHSAILAKAMGIPAVMSVPQAVSAIAAGEPLLVDGSKGRVLRHPSKEIIAHYMSQRKTDSSSPMSVCHSSAITKSGKVKKVYATVGNMQAVRQARKSGCDGIGLVRTEFLFCGNTTIPCEEAQTEIYKTIAKEMAGKEVVIRTLDIGGDKKIAPFPAIAAEANPLLGCRGIRYCLQNPIVFKQQIRALLRAACDGNIKMLLPMVTSVEEVRKVKALIKDCAAELKREGKSCQTAPLGVMIETPAAVFIADALANEVDFFSVGMNDITGYLLAADRDNRHLQKIYDVCHPAVLQAVKMTVQQAHAAGIPACICGEAVTDERLLPLLVSCGADAFSVEPDAVFLTKSRIFRYA